MAGSLRGLEENPDPISCPENGSSSFAPVLRDDARDDEGRRAHSCSSAAFFSGGAEGTRTPDPHTARTDVTNLFMQLRGAEPAELGWSGDVQRRCTPLNAVART
jgi:hypothetical protein